MQNDVDVTATAAAGQVTTFTLPLSDSELEDATCDVRKRARSLAHGFDCRESSLGDWADEAITLAASPAGDRVISPWQFDLLFAEYIGAMAIAIQRRGRR